MSVRGSSFAAHTRHSPRSGSPPSEGTASMLRSGGGGHRSRHPPRHSPAQGISLRAGVLSWDSPLANSGTPAPAGPAEVLRLGSPYCCEYFLQILDELTHLKAEIRQFLRAGQLYKVLLKYCNLILRSFITRISGFCMIFFIHYVIMFFIILHLNKFIYG